MLDIDGEAIAPYPSEGNVSMPEETYDYRYFHAEPRALAVAQRQGYAPPTYRPGHIL